MKTAGLWALAVLSVFAPIKTAVICAVCLVIGDMITGILASRKQNIPISSAGLKRTVGKLAIYEAAILLGYLAQTYMTGTLLPVSNLVTSIIGLTEMKSILENLDIISGGSFFSSLVTKITASKDVIP